ncbi:hypothetical protein [Spirosoma montaniterrae]|uniref:Uncharacterized protein n=1 Tax=Spirosoma montaniterrae TaxID=1178516 RepID=A0A1P9X153_9BACT|nr:hypothetical protein [Spirosoma montaniterrae]AQG81328.1 hypothetical protein AWR27_19595 [Spirosoma montaniterrae]
MTDSHILKEQHRQAMAYAQEAMLAERDKNGEQAILLYRKAFNLEKEVAMSFFSDEQKQPTRAVLFRSAAALAKNCGEYEEAQRLIRYGLSGNPSAAIVTELTALGNTIEEILRTRVLPKSISVNEKPVKNEYWLRIRKADAHVVAGSVKSKMKTKTVAQRSRLVRRKYQRHIVITGKYQLLNKVLHPGSERFRNVILVRVPITLVETAKRMEGRLVEIVTRKTESESTVYRIRTIQARGQSAAIETHHERQPDVVQKKTRPIL